MLEEFTILKTLLKENKLIITIVLILSIISGIFYSINYKPKIISEFELAPYFEFTSDLGRELEKISEAVNRKDTNFIKQKLGDCKLNLEIINKSSYSKIIKGPDFSFKSKNLKIIFELKDSSLTEMENWSNAIVNFCDKYVRDSTRTYRGIEIFKERLKTFSENKYLKNKEDSIADFYKSDYLNQNIKLSDAVLNQLVYAQTLAEYNSIFKNNYYSKFEKSIYLEKRLYTKTEIFTYISIVPIIILIVLIIIIKYDV